MPQLDQAGVQQVSEIAQRVLGELMLSSPGRPSLQTTEGLACAVALYVEKLAQAMQTENKRALELFVASITEYIELGEEQ